jgi:endonuclease III
LQIQIGQAVYGEYPISEGTMKESLGYKKKVAKAMLGFERRVRSRKQNRFSKEDPAQKFLFQVLFDQNMDWVQAWDNVELFEDRLGTLNVKKIAKMTLGDIHSAMKGDKRKSDPDEWKSLHRFPKKLSSWIKGTCKMLVEEYASDPRHIWNNTKSARLIEERLMEFPGIGQKKASMLINILAHNRGFRNINRREIDISVDSLVRRVFLRTGLADIDTTDDIIQVSRTLHPKYPGILDLPAWRIGQDFCFPTWPDCKACPIGMICKKKKWRTRETV